MNPFEVPTTRDINLLSGADLLAAVQALSDVGLPLSRENIMTVAQRIWLARDPADMIDFAKREALLSQGRGQLPFAHLPPAHPIRHPDGEMGSMVWFA